MLKEMSQTEKDKHCMISLVCGTKKKTQKTTNKQTPNKPKTKDKQNKRPTKLLDTENRLVVGEQRWGMGVREMDERKKSEYFILN